MEPENWTPPAKQLDQENIPLLPPAEITDEILTPILWELLHRLALRGFYVLHTDHLSDRELYAKLWERGLLDPAHLLGRNPRGGWFHDFLGSWGDEEMQLWLRYFTSEEERNKHSARMAQGNHPANGKAPLQSRPASAEGAVLIYGAIKVDVGFCASVLAKTHSPECSRRIFCPAVFWPRRLAIASTRCWIQSLPPSSIAKSALGGKNYGSDSHGPAYQISRPFLIA